MRDYERGYTANRPGRDEQLRKAADVQHSRMGTTSDRDEIDDLLDRIERRVAERQSFEAIGARYDEQRERGEFDTDRTYAGETCVNMAETTLGSIERRIENISRAVEEIGHKLHAHADNVHGMAPPSEYLRQDGIAGTDKPQSAIRRIFDALDVLDTVTGYMAEGAGRNTNLA